MKKRSMISSIGPEVLKVAIASALFLTFMTGCANFSSSTPLPQLPEHLRACVDRAALVLPEPDTPTGGLSAGLASELIARLRASELDHDRCADDLAAWYDDLGRPINEAK